VQDRLDNYNIPGAYAAFVGFVDALNNWYIRGRRSRLWSDDNPADKQAAFDTLFTVLTIVCRTAAPMMPFIAERMYRSLTGEKSVHLADWPDYAKLPDDAALVAKMDLARDVCSAVLSLRELHRRRTRLPLRQLTVAHPNAELLRAYAPIISEAVNVKTLVLTADVAQFGRREIKVKPQIGARLGTKMKDVMAAQKAGTFDIRDDGSVDIGGVTIDPADFELRVRTPEGSAAESIDAWRGLVILDTDIDPALQAEGWGRDFIRLVQQSRKNAGFDVTDRIVLTAALDGKIAEAVSAHREAVSAATLAVSLTFGDQVSGEYVAKHEIDDHVVHVGISRVATS
jgi:isoleucyl-tRNA synthetase